MTDTVPIEAYEQVNGKAPTVPYASELELDVAHLALVYPDKRAELIAAGLTEDLFYRPDLRELAATILETHRQGEEVDHHTVKARLPTRYNERTLVDVASRTVGTTARVAEWVAELARLHEERTLDVVLATAQQARADGVPVLKVRQMLERLNETGPAASFVDDPDLDTFLDTDEEPYDFLIPDLIERGDRMIVTGEEGQGKSTLLRSFGVQAAAGIHPFTGDDIGPMSVLLVDCENSERQVRRALAPLRDAAHGRPTNLLRARVLGHAVDLTRAEVYDDLARRIDRYETDLLIIGPIYKLTEDDPTKEVPARQVADALDRLRQVRGTALLLEAHTPYADSAKTKRPMRPYGASLWSRWPEFGIFLAPDGTLTHWRGQRDERDWPRKLTRSKPWPWAVDENAPQEAEEWHGPTRCIEAVIEVLAEVDEELSTSKLRTAMRERGRSFRNDIVAVAANQAADEGQIKRRNGPRGSVLFAANGRPSNPTEEGF